MGLLSRKTEEEKAREAAEAGRVRAAQERAAAEAQAAADRAAAEEAAFVSTLPKWEYRVLTESALAGLGDGKVTGLEELLNEHADEGWRVVAASFTGEIHQSLGPNQNHLYVLLERPRRPDDA